MFFFSLFLLAFISAGSYFFVVVVVVSLKFYPTFPGSYHFLQVSELNYTLILNIHIQLVSKKRF